MMREEQGSLLTTFLGFYTAFQELYLYFSQESEIQEGPLKPNQTAVVSYIVYFEGDLLHAFTLCVTFLEKKRKHSQKVEKCFFALAIKTVYSRNQCFPNGSDNNVC